MGGSNVIYSDSTTQNTAFTTSHKTKLDSIGTITNGVIDSSPPLTTTTVYNISNITLQPGVSTISFMLTYLGLLGQYSAGFSTANNSYADSKYANRQSYFNNKIAANHAFSLSFTRAIEITTQTTYYLH